MVRQMAKLRPSLRLLALAAVIAAAGVLALLPRSIPRFELASSATLMNDATSAFERDDYKQARRSFRILAVRAVPGAETMLGVMAAEGLGRPQNDAYAAAWLMRAARRGYAPAELALAHSFAEGLGVPRDLARARALADSAAIQGLPGASRYADILHQQRDPG